ncbi:unnamed protein product [Schistocephalus solidus]|uniref:PB1 domain-containing protein n=1 Tax=Schistocephalus solidus TaxID=70667 RepID=A0A183TD15_SCHSO|nr:unnamed protein product [Schistocephalus solidus]
MSQPIIVKAKYEKEIRILPVYTDELSFDELYLMVSRMFKGHIATDDDLILKYVDSDRPQEGIEHSLIDEPFKAEKNSITSIEGIVLVDELATVRSQLNNLIDRLSSFRPVNTISTKYIFFHRRALINLKLQKDVGIQETEKFATFPDSPATAVLPPSSKTQTPPPSQTSLFASNPALDAHFSEPEYKVADLHYIRRVLRANGYPRTFVYRCIRKHNERLASAPVHEERLGSRQPSPYTTQSWSCTQIGGNHQGPGHADERPSAKAENVGSHLPDLLQLRTTAPYKSFAPCAPITLSCDRL